MKLNYADRRNDKNILKKEFKIKDIDNMGFVGKVGLIKIKDLQKDFVGTRPDGSNTVLISKGYNLMTLFPKNENYCITVMYDKDWNILQWYFDMIRYVCKYEDGIPYSEDLYLDVVVLPNGEFYLLDEDELEEALNQKLISKEEYDMAYKTMNKIIKKIKTDFDEFCDFTNFCLDTIKF